MGFDTYVHIICGVEVPLSLLKTASNKPTETFVKIANLILPDVIEHLRETYPGYDPYELALAKDDIINTDASEGGYYFLYFDDPCKIYVACYHHSHCAGRVPDSISKMPSPPSPSHIKKFAEKCKLMGIDDTPKFYSITNILH